METVTVDPRQLQLLNDRINQTIEALNQVRLSAHGYDASLIPGQFQAAGGISHTGTLPQSQSYVTYDWQGRPIVAAPAGVVQNIAPWQQNWPGQGFISHTADPRDPRFVQSFDPRFGLPYTAPVGLSHTTGLEQQRNLYMDPRFTQGFPAAFNAVPAMVTIY